MITALEVGRSGPRRCISSESHLLPSSNKSQEPQKREARNQGASPSFPYLLCVPGQGTSSLWVSVSVSLDRSGQMRGPPGANTHGLDGPSTLCVPAPFRPDQDPGPELAAGPGLGLSQRPEEVFPSRWGVAPKALAGLAVPRGTIGTNRRDWDLKGRGGETEEVAREGAVLVAAPRERAGGCQTEFKPWFQHTKPVSGGLTPRSPPPPGPAG